MTATNRDTYTDPKRILGSRVVEFHDIIGQPTAKREIQQLSEFFKHRDMLGLYGISIPNVLLHGPPGTGKTMLVESLAYELLGDPTSLDIIVYSLNLQDIGTAYINETSNNLSDYIDSICEDLCTRDTLNHAIIFMDEFDSIAGKRGTRHSHTEDDKVVNTLNSYLDGDRYLPNINYIAATNNYNLVDPALKSRFGLHLKFDPFKTTSDKSSVLKSSHTQLERRSDPAYTEYLFNRVSEIGFDTVVTTYLKDLPLSGRDLMSIARHAVEHRITELITTNTQQISVCTDDYKYSAEQFVTQHNKSSKQNRQMGFRK